MDGVANVALVLLGIFVPSWIFGRAAAGAWIVPPPISGYISGWVMPAAIIIMMMMLATAAVVSGRA